MQFVDREAELGIVTRDLDSPRPSLFVLYGRRRTGKTALLRKAVEARRSVFFTADLGSPRDQLASFSATISDSLGTEGLEGALFPSWEQALRFCIRRAQKEPLVVILDEFQYVASADPTLPSVLQRLWDAEVQDSRFSLVLCGSYVSFMERQVLGAANPLYGRRTGQLLLAPLHFREAGLFFPGWTPDAAMSATAILGGIPAYLQQFDESQDLATNVTRTILRQGAPLYDEPRFLMMEELREPQVYFSICRAIAHGHGRPNEIAQAAGLRDRGAVGPYLVALQDMKLVERRTPVTVRNPERSRQGVYRLADPFFRFWFRFVYPSRAALEAGDSELVWARKVEPHLAQHVAVAFEEASREHLQTLNRQGKLPATYDRIGGWWRGPHEVDLVGIADDGEVLLAECKWSTRPVGTDVLDGLVDKTQHVLADSGMQGPRARLALFARSGFTRDLQRRARVESVHLFSVEDILSGA
jgi:uncharacterized protein